ncbi:Fatty acid metabolism regulator protein [Planctomycetes bacterium Pan216]|uniref:Fatty acid metabolism regulator protein n=1 Tax=Kolteria novifilia TaxID=2527975 RepID=A0A518B1E8_9BACT|nr:Fatty acid metabolism regulator protein [Planctomycetes bacterium Pan216]
MKSSPLTRKQREIQERQEKILDVSRTMLREGGYHGLNMDRIAAELEYSKGTIYGHFSCKEEIIIALAIQTMEKRMELFRRAALFRGSSRERMTAIGLAVELFVLLYPDHFMVERIIRTESIWLKTSEERRTATNHFENDCFGIVGGVVRDGITRGELVLPDGMSVEDLVFGLWALSHGAYTIMTTNDQLVVQGVREPLDATRRNYAMILDGAQWRPLSSEHDYAAVYRQIAQEIFPDECRRANRG